MRLVTAREMQQIDRSTIDGGLVPSLTLMERAGQAAALEALEMLQAHPGRTEILCGKGNNGGDGLVVARALAESGFPVRVHLTHAPDQLSADARANHARLAGTGVEVRLVPERLVECRRVDDPRERGAGAAGGLPTEDAAVQAWCRELHEAALCVDALLGTGVTEALRGRLAAIVDAVNRCSRRTLSIDIPSGVDGDSGRVQGTAIWADRTVTFGLPKLGLALFPGRERAGQIRVADIGFPPQVIEAAAPGRHWVDRTLVRAMLPRLEPTAHKYARGCVLVLAGSREFTGAAALTATAALGAGAGIVYLVVPRSLRILMQTKLTEVIVHGEDETPEGTLAPAAGGGIDRLLERADALAVGPGLGTSPATLAWVGRLLASRATPAVVDADAIPAIPEGTPPGPRIATPHAGELARWAGRQIASDAERLEVASSMAQARHLVVLAKGAPTFVTTPAGEVFVNSTGHVGLATAGSGDVLTGLVAGLLARGASATAAATLGAYLHGRAAELAAAGRAPESLLAGDLLQEIGRALLEVQVSPHLI